ncbi:MAG: bifunctional UDP-N-acetylglucosamine diphosphorylase/glucosamine-1-phosphate N-acetyltransferase GlmU [Pseudomonadota bacterium]
MTKDWPIAAIILAAGKGTRMKSDTPKVLHAVGGRALLGHVVDAAARLSPERIAVVVGEQSERVSAYATSLNSEITIAVQSPPQGTGHAVAQAMPTLEGFSGAVVILYADTPLISAETVKTLTEALAQGAHVAVLGFRPDDPGAYGRLKVDGKGALSAIVEAKDASPEELAIRLCNSGVMAFDADFLRRRITDINANNAKGEYYLTDLVALAREDGLTCAVIEAEAEEVGGVNARSDLAAVEQVFQARKRTEAMENGATLIDPNTVYFSYDTAIGRDVVIEPNVFFGPGASIADGVTVKAYSHIEGAKIETGATVGPFARLRPGAQLSTKSKVGNFVEVKNATVGAEAKVSHLTYIGDADIGAGANIGAGTITCNYDGFNKYRTVIGENAFIGSNTALVAPVNVGPGAYVGSGSVITIDVAPDALALARGQQKSIKGWAARLRQARQKPD